MIHHFVCSKEKEYQGSQDILKKNSLTFPGFPDQIFTKFPDFLLRIFLFETSTDEISRSKEAKSKEVALTSRKYNNTI